VALGFFAALTVLLTWPLVTRLSQATVSRPGDNLYWIWLIGWVEKALFTLRQSPLTTDLLNYPEGWSLASTEMSPLMVLLALPFSLLATPTLGYNLAALFSFAASGFLAFVWVRHLTGSTWAGLIAGTVFAFFPYRQAHFLAGHLNLLATPAIMGLFLSLERALHGEARQVRWAAAAGLSLGLVAWSSQYYFYMSLVILVVYLAADLIVGGRRSPGPRVYLSRLITAGVVALPLVAVALWPYLTAAWQGVVPPRGMQAAVAYSGSPTDYLLPFTGHPVWGRWVGAHFNRAGWIEASLYAGVVASVLGLLGLVASLRASSNRRRLALVLAGSALVAFVFSLGVTLHWLGEPVHLPLPELLSWMNAEDGTSILMPATLLYRALPYYGSLRVPMRYAAYFELFLSVLAGLGGAWVLERLRGKAVAAAGLVLLALVVLDFLPPRWTLVPVEPRPVDVWLRQQPEAGAVAQFPFALVDEQGLLYATLTHGKPYIGGLYGSFATPQYRAVRPVLDTFPSAESLALLGDLGVRYVVIDTESYEEIHFLDDVELALDRHGLQRAVQLQGQLVYILDR
jgi:hypothetical protein